MSRAEIKVIHDKIDITPIVTSVTWSGDVKRAYRSLSVTLSNTIDGRKKAVNVNLGGEIRFYNGKKELFRGIVFSDAIDEKGRNSLVAYDSNVYLVKNSDDRKFKNLTASAIIKRLCTDFNVPIGEIDDTGYVIPKLLFTDGATLFDMMITALTETEKATGRRYFITNENGKLTVRQRSKKISRWIIESGVNISSAKYTRSIEDLRTDIKVIGDNGKVEVVARVKNDALSKRYGTMQHYEKVSDKITKQQAEQLARELAKALGTIDDEASINALGIDDVIAASSVYVKEEMTGIIGGYYVVSDTHSFSADGTHTVSLRLSATDDLPRLEYDKEASE